MSTLLRYPGPQVRARTLPAGAAPLTIAGIAVVAGLAAAVLGPVALALPVAGVLAVVLVRHPFALLAAFLAIGVFKDTQVLPTLPVDITLLLGALLAGVCVMRVVAGRALKIPLGFAIPFVFIGIMLAVSLTWTPVHGYGLEKAAKFWSFTLLAAVAPFCLIESERDLRDLLRWLLISAMIGALVTVAFGSVGSVDDINNANTGRLQFGGNSNTIFNSRLLAVGALVALFAPWLGIGGRWRWALPPIGLGLAAVCTLIGSRGPLVSLVLAVVLTVTVVILRKPRALIPMLAVIVVAIALFPLIPLPETSSARISGVASNPVGTLQGDGRSLLYAKGIDIAEQHPLVGIGSGGFFLYSAVLENKDERYPHNMFIEAAAEIGIAGAIALAGTIIAAFVGLYRRAFAAPEHQQMLIFVSIGILLFCLFAGQFSGDLNDNRTFWTALGLGWLLAVHGVPDSPEREAGRLIEPEYRD